MDSDMDQMQRNESMSQQNSQGMDHEGGEKDKQASMLSLFEPPAGSVQKLIECRVSNDDEAKKAIQTWMELPENRDFVQQHAWSQQWKPVEGGMVPSIVAFFKKTDDNIGDKPNGKRASPLRNGGTYTNYMRSTNYTSAFPGSGPLPPPPGPQVAGASQGLWRSYHAQQRDVSRERDLSANAEMMRRSRVSGSPVRSHSPSRYAVHHVPPPQSMQYAPQPQYAAHPQYAPHPVPVVDARYAPAFSHYEQHREQREQREHMEHQKIQQEHQKQYEITQISQNIRERIIATYRAEIESHKLSERNFATLRAQIEDINRRREAYEQSVTVLQGDFESQIQSQNSVIGSCQNELEMLKNQNADRAKEGIEVSEQIQAVRVEVNTRDQEIRELSSSIHMLIASNQGLERENENLKMGINEQQEIRSKQQGTIYQQNGALSKWEQECFAQSSRISVLEKERNTLIDRTGALNEQLNIRTQNCDECQNRIHNASTDISQLKNNIHGLDIEINNLERTNNALVEDQKLKLSKNSHEYNTAHELTSALQGLEAKYYSLEVDERGKNTDLEAVNYSNQALMDRNLDLKSEYEALQKHSLLLTQQNKDLQRELDSFVETDDVVRRNLDRKEKVTQIRYRADVGIPEPGPVMMVARSRSPMRAGSPLREVMEHEVRSRSPYAPHYVAHHPGPMMSHHSMVAGVGGPGGPLRREYSPARKENLGSYQHLGMSSYVPGGSLRAGSPLREAPGGGQMGQK